MRTAAAVGERPQLHEVAQLICDPEPVTADPAEVRPAAACERIVQAAPVAHLAHQHVALAPDTQRASPAGVTDAVRGHLVDGEHEVVAPRGAEARRARVAGDEPAHVGQVARGEAAHPHRPRWLRQRVGERGGCGLGSPEALAAPERAPSHDGRMAAMRLRDHAGVERAGVVRAEERQRSCVGKGEVEERFVPLALDELGVAPACPDRLSDPPDARALGGVRLDEFPPGRYQACGICADLAHVGEMNATGIACELRSQEPDLVRVDGDDDGIAGRERVPDEGDDARQEFLLSGIQERFVPEHLTGARSAQAAADRCEPTAVAWSRDARAASPSPHSRRSSCLRLGRTGIPVFRLRWANLGPPRHASNGVGLP